MIVREIVVGTSPSNRSCLREVDINCIPHHYCSQIIAPIIGSCDLRQVRFGHRSLLKHKVCRVTKKLFIRRLQVKKNSAQY